MAVNDRWFVTERQGDGTRKKVKSADHGCRERWQVRWRDEQNRQRKQSFTRKLDAEAFDAKIKTQLKEGTYVDPAAGQVTFRTFAEEWRRNRDHDPTTAARVEANFRNHCYSEDGRGGRTPQGAPSIGDYPLRVLATRPSLLQAWVKSMPLGPNTKLLVIGYVSQVFKAAVADRLIVANPLKGDSVQKPAPVKTEAVPWTAVQVADVASHLRPERLAALPYLGAAAGLRQGEMLAVALPDLSFLRRSLHVEIQIKLVDGTWCFAPLKNYRSCPARDVPVEEPVLSILAEHVRKFPPVPVTLPWKEPGGRPVTRELLFTVDGGHVERNVFNWWWGKAWRAAGVPDRGPRLNGCHVLRHTAASAWLSAGLNLAAVAAYLGDTIEVVMSSYAHFMPADEDRARAVMRAFFTPAEILGSARDVPGAAR